MDNLDFSEEEIQEQLAILGYKNIPKHRLHEFKKDLDDLIQRGQWETLTSPAPIKSPETPTVISQPSPPAYTKEKVGHCYVGEPGQGFFLHARQTTNDRKIFSTCQNRNYGHHQGLMGDSYAQHSVAPMLQLPPAAPSRLRVEPDPDDSLPVPLMDSYTSSPDTQGKHFVKRIVLRKQNGHTLVCDESVYSEDSDAASLLEERLAELHLSTSAQRDFETEDEDVDVSSESDSQISDAASMGAFESYIRGMTRAQSHSDIRPKPKSFIRPVMSQQKKKTDPVAKYFQYKQLWDLFKTPGEKDRRGLRLEIKERLAYQPPQPKPRRALVPNTYIVPTEKKRSALRWEIRNDLANGVIPYKFSY